MTISIKKATENRLIVACPYNTDFITQARAAGGSWNSGNKAWIFPGEQLNAVRAILRDVYGYDDTAGADAPTLRLRCVYNPSWQEGREHDYRDEKWPATHEGTQIFIGGRSVARVFGRDSGAKLGEYVVITRGHIDSGGSVKNPRISISENLIVDLLRMPEPVARRLSAEHPAHFRIVANDGTELAARDDGDNVVSFPGA